MTADSTPRRLARDLMAAIAAFAIVFAVGYIGGRAAMPTFRLAVGELPVEDTDASGEVSLVDLRADLASLEGPAAVMAATGAIEGRLLLDHAEGLSNNALLLPSEDEPPALDVHARFTGAEGSLTIKADQMARGEARTEGMTVVFASEGLTFNPRPGMCTLELDDFGFTTMQRPWGKISVPWYEGSLTCSEVPELRSEQAASFTVVFEMRSH